MSRMDRGSVVAGPAIEPADAFAPVSAAVFAAGESPSSATPAGLDCPRCRATITTLPCTRCAWCGYEFTRPATSARAETGAA